MNFDAFHANRKSFGVWSRRSHALCKDRRRRLGLPLLELFRHAEMFLKMRERLAGPGFQLGIFTAF